MSDPASWVANGPTPSEQSCLKSAAGCNLARSLKSSSRDSIKTKSSSPTTLRNSGWTRKLRPRSLSLSTSTMTSAAPEEASLQVCGLYSRAQNCTWGFPSASRWSVFKSMGSIMGVKHCIDNILNEFNV